VRILTQASLAAIIALLVSVTPMLTGVLFAIRPTERRLALMRPLTMAGIFAAMANVFLGLVNALVYLARTGASDPAPFARAMQALAETAVMPFIAFACLTVGWLCVAIGMRRTTDIMS
jgi:hypothetical protein